MRPWHYSRIRFRLEDDPHQAIAGNWVFFFVCVKNSDPKSPFRETHYALETIGL